MTTGHRFAPSDSDTIKTSSNYNTLNNSNLNNNYKNNMSSLIKNSYGTTQANNSGLLILPNTNINYPMINPPPDYQSDESNEVKKYNNNGPGNLNSDSNLNFTHTNLSPQQLTQEIASVEESLHFAKDYLQSQDRLAQQLQQDHKIRMDALVAESRKRKNKERRKQEKQREFLGGSGMMLNSGSSLLGGNYQGDALFTVQNTSMQQLDGEFQSLNYQNLGSDQYQQYQDGGLGHGGGGVPSRLSQMADLLQDLNAIAEEAEEESDLSYGAQLSLNNNQRSQIGSSYSYGGGGSGGGVVKNSSDGTTGGDFSTTGNTKNINSSTKSSNGPGSTTTSNTKSGLSGAETSGSSTKQSSSSPGTKQEREKESMRSVKTILRHEGVPVTDMWQHGLPELLTLIDTNLKNVTSILQRNRSLNQKLIKIRDQYNSYSNSNNSNDRNSTMSSPSEDSDYLNDPTQNPLHINANPSDIFKDLIGEYEKVFELMRQSGMRVRNTGGSSSSGNKNSSKFKDHGNTGPGNTNSNSGTSSTSRNNNNTHNSAAAAITPASDAASSIVTLTTPITVGNTPILISPGTSSLMKM